MNVNLIIKVCSFLAKLVDCIVVAFALVDDFATLNFDNQFFLLLFVQVLIMETGFLRYMKELMIS